jgi:hypothetical protein
MSYIDVNDDGILNDINVRKEFQMLSKEHKHVEEKNIIPYFMLKQEMSKGKYLRLRSYQLFGRNFMNPNTPYTRLMVLHDMGTGKTTTGISIAMEFIRYFKHDIKNENQPFVYIVGFTRAQFERDLFRFTEFGFITRLEQEHLSKLRRYAQTGSETDIAVYKDFQIKIRRRLSNKKGNGYIKFIGYRELANHVFISNKNVTKMSETDITASIADGSLVVDYEYIAKFKHCLFICDEIHNVYNSLAKNNWGIAIQIILNEHANNIRAVFLSGTVLKNSQTEIVDVLNLISGTKENVFTKSDFFDSNNQLLPNATSQISKHSRGRVSFLVDVNPSRYPSQSYVGTKIDGAKYLSFVRTTMPKLQHDTYMSIENDKAMLHEHGYIFDMVFPNPVGKLGIFKSSQLRSIESATSDWRKKMGISIDSKSMTVDGDMLHVKNLVKYSSKYPKLLEILDETRAVGNGKSFIYHKFVHMTGVFLIGNLLSSNGYLSINAPVSGSTKCALCKHVMTTHPKDHVFAPARYILIHGELNKKAIVSQLDTFNSADNIDGSKIMCIVGSRVMREAYDLDSVRNEIIISRPDNIPSLLQIIARGVRAGSHQLLPANNRNVKVYILTSVTADGKMTYEENRYVKKVNDYIVIQHIEKALHASALDGVINRDLIEPALVNDDIGHLHFYPNIKIDNKIKPEDLNMSTFNVYHNEYEVIDIIYIVKRLFMSHSKIWKHDDLWNAVRNPPFDFEYDPSLFSYESFVIALERLIWSNDYFIEIKENPINVLDTLQDESDKQLILHGNTRGAVIQIGEYYMAVTMNMTTMMPDIYIDSPFRLKTPERNISVDVSEYTRSVLSTQRYNNLKLTFMGKFKNLPISQMTDAICVHGPDFHILLIEEIILYIFNLWTNPKVVASKEFNAFYFQMIYYYDIMGLVVWMNSARGIIREMYDEYDITTVNEKASSIKLLPKKYHQQNRGDLINIARSIERAGCSWCPNTTTDRFNDAILNSKNRFVKLTQSKLKATDDIIPIGHFIDDVPRFYHPERLWFSSPEYTQTDIEWKENNIIIGFDTRSDGGLHIRFKLRNPKQKIKHHKDSRLAERGVICTSRSKPYLLLLLKKLDVKGTTPKDNITTLCKEIRTRLMYLELVERAKNSNIKWYYNQFEDGSDLE